MNYVHTLLYPVSVSNFTIPESGVHGNLIEDINLFSAHLLFTLLPACKQ